MKVIIFSSLPPPIGGVTRSVENLLQACKTKAIDCSIVTQHISFKPLLHKYDIAHIHYSKSWKRFLGLLLGKLVAKKVIFTLHGNDYKDNKLNDMSAKLADGVILLNRNAEEKYKNLFKNTVILGSIFSEGVDQNTLTKTKYFEKKDDKVYLLVYAFDKTYRDSKDIYGVDFILEHILKLDEKYVVVLLDIKGAYKEDVETLKTDKLIYLDYEVDFLSLLFEVDIYVRPTSTDGASVAVQEALMLGKNVLASNSVERPEDVTLYEHENFQDFKEKLGALESQGYDFLPNSVDDYIKYCESLLKKQI